MKKSTKLPSYVMCGGTAKAVTNLVYTRLCFFEVTDAASYNLMLCNNRPFTLVDGVPFSAS